MIFWHYLKFAVRAVLISNSKFKKLVILYYGFGSSNCGN